jgi:FAD:protein FMN transferase
MTGTVTDATMTFRSMATDVTIQAHAPNPETQGALQRARAVFERVEAACTRFDPTSPLMRANADPMAWHEVPWECAAAVAEAARAHEETGGVFDPRVLDALVNLGYDRSLPFTPGRLSASDVGETARGSEGVVDTPSVKPPWRPRWELVGDQCRIHLGGARIDLGGIGKGLAVRWAAEQLRGAGDSIMVEAGGDCQFIGAGPNGLGWRVGMEDPLGGQDPLLVFELSDIGCATSSIRVRRWNKDGRQVHHLIDPSTGDSGGSGLLSVTVIHPDAATAEVWSKTLFLSGRDAVESIAERRRLAAAWVDTDGGVHLSRAAARFVIWAGPNV